VDIIPLVISEGFNNNANFHQHPKRAGKKIWGSEREPPTFSDANNCKDPRYGGELIRVYLMASGRKGLPLAAVRSEAIGTKRTCCRSHLMSVVGERTDLARIGSDV
jgi:hypothetical protein